MLTTELLHPDLLAALGAAGHGSTVLLADANYPVSTATRPGARVVHLNLSPGVVGVLPVLRALLTAVPVEAAQVMESETTGDHVLDEEPPIWSEYRTALLAAGVPGTLEGVERFAFYDQCRGQDLALVVATAETAIYANLLLRVGVRKERS